MIVIGMKTFLLQQHLVKNNWHKLRKLHGLEWYEKKLFFKINFNIIFKLCNVTAIKQIQLSSFLHSDIFEFVFLLFFIEK